MYTVEALPDVVEQLATLPRGAQLAYAELVGLLQLTPENGTPYNARIAGGRMRTHPFGDIAQGLAAYLVLADERRVVVLNLAWVD